MGFKVIHEAEVEIDGYDVAVTLGHDMEKLIDFIKDIDRNLQDPEFPKAVMKWAKEAAGVAGPAASHC